MSRYAEAKELYNKGKYSEAYNIAIELTKDPFCSEYSFYLLFNCLRKLGKSEECLSIIDELVQNKVLCEKNIINPKSWCIYDLYVKNYDPSLDYDIYEKSNYIFEKCKQEEKIEKSPYVLTIFKIVNAIKTQSSPNYKKIIELLEKLDYTKLPDKCDKKEDNDVHKYSMREIFYTNITKAYEKCEEYEKCVKMCEAALADNIILKDKKWIEGRLLYCKCMISKNKFDDIQKYKEYADKNRIWHIYNKLSEIYYANNEIENALIYACLAFDIREETKKMVNVMFNLGRAFENYQKFEGYLFFQACAYYRELNGYKIDENLKSKIEGYNLNIDKEPDINSLKDLTLVFLTSKTNKNYGKIIKLGDVYGFIKQKNSKDIYFKKKDIMNKKKHLPVGSYVEFELQDINGRSRAIKIRAI